MDFMRDELGIIQEKLLRNLERLDEETVDIEKEVARSNAISQLANTYIKSCNLVIRVEESKKNVKNKIVSIKNEKK